MACGIVEPSHGSHSFDEIDRCAGELELVALSFHTRFQGVSLDSQWIHRYLERMGGVGLVPIIHAMDDTPEEALWKLAAVARAHPDLTIVALDGFGGFEATRSATTRRRPSSAATPAACCGCPADPSVVCGP